VSIYIPYDIPYDIFLKATKAKWECAKPTKCAEPTNLRGCGWTHPLRKLARVSRGSAEGILQRHHLRRLWILLLPQYESWERPKLGEYIWLLAVIRFSIFSFCPTTFHSYPPLQHSFLFDLLTRTKHKRKATNDDCLDDPDDPRHISKHQAPYSASGQRNKVAVKGCSEN